MDNLNISNNSIATQKPAFSIWQMMVSAWRNTLTKIQMANIVARERKALSWLSDHDLKDIGLTRADADIESRRTYFDVPCQRIITLKSCRRVEYKRR